MPVRRAITANSIAVFDCTLAGRTPRMDCPMSRAICRSRARSWSMARACCLGDRTRRSICRRPRDTALIQAGVSADAEEPARGDRRRSVAITYLAISHMHADHTGNANDYASATWLVQEAERDFAFRPARTRRVVPCAGRQPHTSRRS
jgi:glyoxylase-like metal-dependent hydrolase (beta-lactamase superfamily II)